MTLARYLHTWWELRESHQRSAEVLVRLEERQAPQDEQRQQRRLVIRLERQLMQLHREFWAQLLIFLRNRVA